MDKYPHHHPLNNTTREILSYLSMFFFLEYDSEEHTLAPLRGRTATYVGADGKMIGATEN